MIVRLLADFSRRRWPMILLSIVQIDLYTGMVRGFWPSANLTASTMACAWFASLFAGLAWQSREYYLLPVSRRDWWRARWWSSAVVIPAWSALVIALSWRWRAGAWPDAGEVGLGALMAFLYCGCALSVHASSVGRLLDAPAGASSIGKVLPIVIGLLAAPIAMAPYVPRTPADVTAIHLVVLAVMAAGMWKGFRHAPPIEARAMRLYCEPRCAPALLYGVPSYPHGSRELTAEMAWDPLSIAAGGTSQVNMSVDGASPGDFVQASFSVATTAVLFLATVGASDTVTVVAWNRATSAIDLAGGTLRVRVTKA